MSRYSNFRLVACPESELGGRLYLHAALACGDCTVLIEEISQWCAPAGLSRELELLIRAGRHKNIRVLGASQRPADVHKLVMSQADLVLGRIYEANDTIYLRHFFREADRLKDLPEPEVRKEKGRLFLRAAFVRPLVGPDHFLIDLPI